MLQSIFKKWWVILIQGLLFVILGIYVMRHPADMLVGLSFWLGVLTLVAGITGLLGYFFASKPERENQSLLWSLLTAILGVLMLANLMATMKLITIFFGLWFLSTGWFLAIQGWSLREAMSFGWVIFGLGVLAVIGGVMMVFDIGKGAVGVSVFLGLQAVLAGVGFIILAFLKRYVVKNLSESI
jgi:uncharacterized membrane protein HdeD (DUF308 family)